MKKLIVASLLVAISLYLLFSVFVIDAQINKYDTRQTVIENSAIKDGRVPELLPQSAYDIIEMYDKKTNAVYGAFSYKEVDEASLIQQMKKTKDGEGTLEWGNFLFHIDRDKNRVKYKTKTFIPKGN